MNNLILKTIIFILKDKETQKPVVVTHFTGFDTDEEAQNFGKFLTNKFTTEDDLDPKRTLH